MIGVLLCLASSVATLVLNVGADASAGVALFGTMCCWYTWGREALMRRRLEESTWLHEAFVAAARAAARERRARIQDLGRRPPAWRA